MSTDWKARQAARSSTRPNNSEYRTRFPRRPSAGQQHRSQQAARSSTRPNNSEYVSRFQSTDRDRSGRPGTFNGRGQFVPAATGLSNIPAGEASLINVPGRSPGFTPPASAPSTPPGGGWRDPSRGAPLPPQQSSGRSIPRAVIKEDGTAAPIPPATPSFGGAGFNPLATPGSLPYNPAELQKELATGGGWTNAGLVAGLQTDLNPTVKDTFTANQIGSSFAAPGQPVAASPVAAPPGFQMAGSLLDTQPQVQPLTGQLFNAAGGVPNAYGSPDVVQASLTTPEPVAPEVAAQSMASDAVNKVRSLQEQIMQNRGLNTSTMY